MLQTWRSGFKLQPVTAAGAGITRSPGGRGAGTTTLAALADQAAWRKVSHALIWAARAVWRLPDLQDYSSSSSSSSSHSDVTASPQLTLLHPCSSPEQSAVLLLLKDCNSAPQHWEINLQSCIE
jgi:hypothetical protein